MKLLKSTKYLIEYKNIDYVDEILKYGELDFILVRLFNITGFYTMLLLFSIMDFVVLLPIYFYGESRI